VLRELLVPQACQYKKSAKAAALFFNPQNVDEMADALMRIYKDEEGRRALIEQGKVVAEKNTVGRKRRMKFGRS